MKTKLLTLFSLLVLLLVSTAILADGRPTGIRIGRAVSGGGTNMEIDVTVTGTNYYYYDGFYTVLLGAGIRGSNGPATFNARQYVDNNFNTWFPYAIDWGDGNSSRVVELFGGGPWTGTFAHTYLVPGTYTITVGDAVCCQSANTGTVNTGNAITESTRYIFQTGQTPFFRSWTYTQPQILAITANATVTTGTGIPTMNIYGLLALSFVLVGTGLLLYRKPQRTVA